MSWLGCWRNCIMLVIVAAGTGICYGEPAPALVRNGSFEKGQDAPLGWNRQVGGNGKMTHHGWTVRTARCGND
jgi:hypothetical protein